MGVLDVLAALVLVALMVALPRQMERLQAALVERDKQVRAVVAQCQRHALLLHLLDRHRHHCRRANGSIGRSVRQPAARRQTHRERRTSFTLRHDVHNQLTQKQADVRYASERNVGGRQRMSECVRSGVIE